MKVHAHFQQKSGGDATQEWIEARVGKITASEFDRIADSEGNLRKGQMPKTYLAEKLAERWTGRAAGGFISMAVNNGVIIEEKAAAFAALEYGLDIKHVGFVESDAFAPNEYSLDCGCSPDGLVGWDCEFNTTTPTDFTLAPAGASGIEIKCPELKTHIGYLLAGKLPSDYLAQVQGSMLVTGCATWHFMSYPLACYMDGFPALHLVVERDDKYQANLAESLESFLATYEAAWKRLIEMNGGPPPPRQKMMFSMDEQSPATRESIRRRTHGMFPNGDVIP